MNCWANAGRVERQIDRCIAEDLEAQILNLRRQRRAYAQIMMARPVSKGTLSRILRRHHLTGSPPRAIQAATGDRTQRSPGAGVESLHTASRIIPAPPSPACTATKKTPASSPRSEKWSADQE